jgi:signal transduction histidine kinase
MVSNHIVTPLWLALRVGSARAPGDVRGLVLMSRRLSIGAVLALGYTYYHLSGGSAALAAIGLISFVGVAQVLPAMVGGIYWRGATHIGAALGLITGFSIWLYCLFLPSFGEGGLISARVMADGLFGVYWLRPHALFGITGLDPLLHALLWSMLLNTAAFLIGSLASFPGPMERLQGVAFVNIFDQTSGPGGWARSAAEAEDLLSMSQRILGPEEAQRFFQAQAAAQGKLGYLPDPTPDFIARLERQLAGSVGAATAHAMISQLSGGATVSVQDLIAVAGEAQQIKEYSAQLEAKSEELARTARALREANDKLTGLSVQKDAFLSQISHELRTPMTSIRAFSEILMETDLPDEMRSKYAGIIHDETRRLTRLLDDLLDLSVLENRKVQLTIGVANLHDIITKAVTAASNTRPERVFVVQRDAGAEHMPVFTDTDRLLQVFINLVSNARKYCDAERAVLRIEVRKRGGYVEVDFIDNGSGIPKTSQALIFEKFARLTDTSHAGGAGLGLAICREIMANLGGSIDYIPGQGGAAFRVRLTLKRSG